MTNLRPAGAVLIDLLGLGVGACSGAPADAVLAWCFLGVVGFGLSGSGWSGLWRTGWVRVIVLAS